MASEGYCTETAATTAAAATTTAGLILMSF